MELVLLLIGGVGAGLFGSLLGLGGGILIVPLLTLGAGLPIRDAVGVSLVCVIVTSGASASVFLRRRVANLRLGMVLELATAVGALIGGLIAFLIDERMLAFLFAVLLAYVALTMLRAGRRASAAPPPMAVAAAPATPADRLSGPGYQVRRRWFGAVSGLGAGVLSALLGIGGGVVMVPAMSLAMGIPLRVATATSNLMIGVTATASAIIYLLRGGIDAYIAGPTAIGVFLGAAAGSRVAGKVDLHLLRLLFVVVQLYVAVQMVLRALGMV